MSRAFVVCAVWLVAVSNSYGQFLEFCDDFTKSASAQRDPWEERIETERHDFTQSAVTVGRHVAQLEAGYSYFYKDDGHEIETSHTTPEMLLRVGLSEDIEFRVRWNYAWQFIEDENDRIGSEDLRYSIKLQMTRQCCGGLLPTSALEIRASAPTGGDSLTTEEIEVSLDYIYQWQLTEEITFAGSTGFGTSGFGDFGLIPAEPADDHFTAITQSAVLGVELSEANTLYLEWFGISSTGLAEEFDVSMVNLGIDHYVTDDFVIDFRIGTGLNQQSDDLFTGVGGGYRF